MPAGLAAPARVEAAPVRVHLSARLLLCIYLVIPVSLLAVALDRWVLSGSLLAGLPSDPTDIFVYQLMFGWPHILASNFILVSNREYLRVFRWRLLAGTVAIVAFFGIGNEVLPYNVLFFVAATATIVHVFRQQVGIGRGLARLSSWLYDAWAWTGIAIGVVLYNVIFLGDDTPEWATRWSTPVLRVLAGALVVLAVLCHLRISSGIGRAFLWANTLLVLVPLVLHRSGYDLFTVAIPRIVHDTTAFVFYVVHDHNRHGERPQNLFYRAFGRLPLATVWLMPVLVMGVAYLLREHGDAAVQPLLSQLTGRDVPKAITLGVLGYLGMMHYYAESFTWQGRSPHRRHIAFRS